ncbi:hypothetical protein WMY93_027853 [Mugilogobius chulae]|uniref:Uncharacterized protein n=1 Tax=Mugilogobius chulae TaxID=88201 RepID=A0AAW0MYF7_9GOBI
MYRLQPGHVETVDKFCDSKCQKLLLYALIFVVVLSQLFIEGFACSCEPQKQSVACNRALFRVLQIFTHQRGTGQRIWSRGSPLWSMMVQMLRALVISLAWVVCVLFNGSWWVCCRVEDKGNEAKVPCKNLSELTSSEKSIIAQLKTQSRAAGLGVLLTVIILFAVVSVMKMFMEQNEKLSNVIWRMASKPENSGGCGGINQQRRVEPVPNAVVEFIKKLNPPNKKHSCLTQNPPEPGLSLDSPTAPTTGDQQ